MDSLFTKIKAVVTPLQAAEHCGLPVKRGGMTCCVFHNDRHPSMKLYPDGCLHRALDMAVRIDYIPKNPTAACVIPRVVAKEIKPLDVPDQKKLFSVLKESRYCSLFIVDIFTGMRVGEIIGLTWDCVDFDNGLIHIEKQIVQTRKKGAKYPYGSL